MYFGKGRRQHVDCRGRDQAELVARVANLGVTGDVTVPASGPAAAAVLAALNDRHERASVRLLELAANRSGDPDMREEVFRLLERWFVLGKPKAAGGPK